MIFGENFDLSEFNLGKRIISEYVSFAKHEKIAINVLYVKNGLPIGSGILSQFQQITTATTGAIFEYDGQHENGIKILMSSIIEKNLRLSDNTDKNTLAKVPENGSENTIVKLECDGILYDFSILGSKTDKTLLKIPTKVIYETERKAYLALEITSDFNFIQYHAVCKNGLESNIQEFRNIENVSKI